MLQRLTSCQRQREKKKEKNDTQQEKKLDFYHCPKQYLLYSVPVCGGFVAHYLRLFVGHVLWLYNNGKKCEKRGYATVGTKHIYQREIFQLHLFNFKCFCVPFLSLFERLYPREQRGQ